MTKKQIIKLKNNKYLDSSSIYKNAMTISVDDTTARLASWQTYKLISYTKVNSVGNKMIFSNGTEIGKNVSKVRVSAMLKIYNDTESGTGFNFSILLNGVAIYSTYETLNIGAWLNSVIPNIILNVKENDVLTLGITAGIPGQYRAMGGYLTVEEL